MATKWNDTYEWDQDPEALKPYAFNWKRQIQAGDSINEFSVECDTPGCKITRVELDAPNHIVSFWIEVTKPGQTFELIQRCTTVLGSRLKLTTFLNCGVR